MENIFDVLKDRGFVKQFTHEDEIRELLGKEKITFYIGFDPTADSLHVGHFVQLMAMSHLQKAGHRPIFLAGGGTGMVGDPSGRTDMRQMMTPEIIQHNVNCFIDQSKRLIDLSENSGAIIENNANWLLSLNYISFIREIGTHFSVNRMLTAECFKNRMEKGLSFFEFNYMIMQAYDFLELFRRYGCRLQLGGDDQWSNIIAGADLIRRVESEPAYGMTFTLLTTSEGVKMGKTQSGAVWLDPKKTSPFEFYQYWRNVADADVEKCLSLLTFIPMDEVRKLGALEGAEINRAKEILAFEVTKLVHGEEEATKAEEAAKALFGQGALGGSIPSTDLPRSELAEGIDIITLLVTAELIPSRGEGRRLIQQGGVAINDEKITDINTVITLDFFKEDTLMIKKGKKTYHQVKLV
ncbi:tyrosine--tRNA ligase [Alkaliphilus oremlandii]|uniref:Tyrosine--tRNA ligase n=1 Tax=Alkaliphilus oremlandii (strain OhILAs) TaxID=350688 RepID=A8MEY9_ALKOO|nr:tyrosine--tRNA ligase [Alkaliphilus oremlandii]ABW18468.1 tyrosyl-tRNA synthetase [Alkaliphilus oremlandii OhILAs]